MGLHAPTIDNLSLTHSVKDRQLTITQKARRHPSSAFGGLRASSGPKARNPRGVTNLFGARQRFGLPAGCGRWRPLRISTAATCRNGTMTRRSELGNAIKIALLSKAARALLRTSYRSPLVTRIRKGSKGCCRRSSSISSRIIGCPQRFRSYSDYRTWRPPTRAAAAHPWPAWPPATTSPPLAPAEPPPRSNRPARSGRAVSGYAQGNVRPLPARCAAAGHSPLVLSVRSSHLEYSKTPPPPARSVRQDDPGLSKTARKPTSGSCSVTPRVRRMSEPGAPATGQDPALGVRIGAYRRQTPTPHALSPVGAIANSPGRKPQVYPHLWPVPLGTRDNSPAFQCWESEPFYISSPGGTTESLSRLSGTRFERRRSTQP